MNEIHKVCSVDNADEEKVMKEVLKNLEYRYNFLKLTHPNIYKELNQEAVDKKLEENKSAEKNEYLDGLMNVINKKVEKTPEEAHKETVSELKTGKYVYKDGKLVEGEAAKRVFVEYSNWYAGNVDPEDLKRHKELLDRQHYRGPTWEGVGKPKSIMDEANPLSHLEGDIETEENPNKTKPKEGVFATVKR